jgi:hypothetical protein
MLFCKYGHGSAMWALLNKSSLKIGWMAAFYVHLQVVATMDKCVNLGDQSWLLSEDINIQNMNDSV